MPSYTYDPQQGQAVPTESLTSTVGANHPSTEQIYQQAEEHHQDLAARNLADRQSQKVADNNPTNIDVEVKLQQLQQRLYRGDYNGPLEEQQLINQTEELAALLTGSVAPTQSQEPEISLKDDLVQELANDPATIETLQFAADTFDPEVSEMINLGLETASAISTQTAIGALGRIKNNPEWIGSGEATQIDPGAINEIASQFDQKTASAIELINANLVAGNITKGQALSTAMRDSRILDGLLWAAQQNLITLNLN